MLQNVLGISMEAEMAFTKKYWTTVGLPYVSKLNISPQLSALSSLHTSISSMNLTGSAFLNFKDLNALLPSNQSQIEFANLSSYELPSVNYEVSRRSADLRSSANQSEPISLQTPIQLNTTYSNSTPIDSVLDEPVEANQTLQQTVGEESGATIEPIATLTNNSSDPFSTFNSSQTTTTMKPNSIQWIQANHRNHTKLAAQKHELNKQKLEQHLQKIKEHNKQTQLKLQKHHSKGSHCNLNATNPSSTCSLSPKVPFGTRFYNALDRLLTDWVIVPGEIVERVSVRLFYNLLDDVRLLYQMTRTLLGVTESTCRYKLACLSSHFVAMHVPAFVRNNIPTSGEQLYVNLIEAASQSEMLNAFLTGIMRFDCDDIYRHYRCP
jgi:hypothetical protein